MRPNKAPPASFNPEASGAASTTHSSCLARRRWAGHVRCYVERPLTERRLRAMNDRSLNQSVRKGFEAGCTAAVYRWIDVGVYRKSTDL